MVTHVTISDASLLVTRVNFLKKYLLLANIYVMVTHVTISDVSLLVTRVNFLK